MSAPEQAKELPRRDLDGPSSVEELYDARGEEVDELRPICQGDIYSGLQMPGFHEDELVMLIAHPCSLRQGATLRPRLQASPVRGYDKVPLKKWSGHGRVLPLPDVLAGPHLATALTETGVVQSADLPGASRVARLSRRGILLLQQRIIYTLAHAVVGLDTLATYSALALDEVELLEDWNEALCGGLSGAELQRALDQTAHEFEEFMKTGPRNTLEEPTTRGEARTVILAEAHRLKEERDGQ
jgi:hypothetical protein